ncbi:MAG TPA: PLP-dependent aminotransferase family protein, partial [Sutterellaceae bacterium]|nr:PLP-dependent aminotransferase family protein [Sutterellaceae bacterium]
YKEGAPCIYLGSFTKVIYPGFNMAYMVVPKNLITVFEGAKLLIDRHSSEVHQYILAEFIQNGFYYSHVRRLKKIYEKRRQAAVRAIGKYLSAYGHIEGANEGTHLTFIFNHPQDDVKLSELFKRSYQIETRPLSACYRSAKPLTGFILGYAHFTEEELEHAVLKLKDALEQTLG